MTREGVIYKKSVLMSSVNGKGLTRTQIFAHGSAGASWLGVPLMAEGQGVLCYNDCFLSRTSPHGPVEIR